MALKSFIFSIEIRSRINLEIKFLMTFDADRAALIIQVPGAYTHVAQWERLSSEKSLIFICKILILGSFRRGSGRAVVSSIFFAFSSGNLWRDRWYSRHHNRSHLTNESRRYLRDAKNIQAYCTCNTLRSTYS